MDYAFNWDIVWQYRAAFAAALLRSLALAAAALIAGFGLGLPLALLARSRHRALRWTALCYVAVMRNTPLLLLVFMLYLILPEYGLRGVSADHTFVVALAAIGAAYLGENFRAALASVPGGLVEAARAIGLVAWQRQVFVILPLALRTALPSLTNTTVMLFKDTAVASVISVRELTYVAREISTDYFRVFEAWLAVGGIYLAVCSMLTLAANGFARRLRRLS